MDIRIEKVDAARAEALLGSQRNRNLNLRHAQRLARDMESGNWRPNSAIHVAATPDGERLIDGQHRLHAVILSGKAQEFVVIYGLRLEDQEVIDTGRTRSLSDALAIRGEPNASLLAAAAGWLWRRQRGIYVSSGSPTIAEGLRLLSEHETLRQSIPSVREASRLLKIPYGLATCLHYQMAELDSESADAFWELLGSGLLPGDRHPIHVLRKRLEGNAVSSSVKLEVPVIHALVIKAWNSYLRGDELTFVRWTRGGASPEQFPELEGPQS